MDSPVRKMQKRNDYNRHKLLRKIRRQRKAQVEQQKVAAEKEIKRRLRVTPPKFGDGKEPTLLDADKVRMNEQGLFQDEAGNIVGDSVVLPELTVRAHKGYKSAYDKNVLNTLYNHSKQKMLESLRQGLYERVDPTSYDIQKAAKQFLYKGRETTEQDIYDALWAKYLNRTNQQVGYDIDSFIQPAIYNPTIGTPIGRTYRLLPKSWKHEDNLAPLGDIQLYFLLKSGNKSRLVNGNGTTMTGLGDYTVSLGHDSRGKYMSYYDEWDLSPIGNKAGKIGKDQSFGIGIPFSVYDRRYYTDQEADSIIKTLDPIYK